MAKKGFFIVLDGTDGSGKTIHTRMLAEKFRKAGRKVETIDFPRFGAPSAHFVHQYLNKVYGTPNEVGPHKASIFYALDRFEHAPIIRKWLEEGKIVISNRYVSANMGHQTGKIKGKAKRDKFLSWLSDLEYGLFKIPKPDLNILIYMPPEIGQKLVDQKGTRAYIKGKKRDAHEEDINHLKNASSAYLYVAKKYKWPTVSCVVKGILRKPEEINQEIYNLCKKGKI